MGIIDLTVSKPAWNRTEVVEPAERAESTVTEQAEPAASGQGESAATEEPAGSGGRFSRSARVVGGVAVGTVGLLTLRKLRNRRRRKSRTDDSAE